MGSLLILFDHECCELPLHFPPNPDCVTVALICGDEPTEVLSIELIDFLVRFFENLLLLVRNRDI